MRVPARMREQREIVPMLDAFSLNEIAKATGLSLAACSASEPECASRIRGIRKPSARWSRLGMRRSVECP